MGDIHDRLGWDPNTAWHDSERTDHVTDIRKDPMKGVRLSLNVNIYTSDGTILR